MQNEKMDVHGVRYPNLIDNQLARVCTDTVRQKITLKSRPYDIANPFNILTNDKHNYISHYICNKARE